MRVLSCSIWSEEMAEAKSSDRDQAVGPQRDQHRPGATATLVIGHGCRPLDTATRSLS